MKNAFHFAVAALIALAALASCREGRKTLPALPGNPAPGFTLRDPDGGAARLGDFAGKIVILDFWATWCGPCRETTGELETLHRKYGAKGVVIVGISLDKGAAAAQKVKAYAVNRGITYRLLMDDEATSRAYAATRIPDTYVLDRDHRILKNYPGYRKDLAGRIEADIEGMMKESSPSATSSSPPK